MTTPKVKNSWLRDNALNVMDAVVDAIVTMDAEGIIQYANSATYRLFDYPSDGLVGQPVTILMPEPHRTQHQQYVSRFMSTGSAQIIGIGRELTAVTRDGRLFPIYLAVSEISTPIGIFFAGILRDLTQQKIAQEALLEQQDRLARVGRLSTMGEMTASIAHEINQPLTAISMYAQACNKLLQSPTVDRDKLTTALEKLTRQTLRAGAIIERIQRFVRNETGQRELVNLNLLVRDLSHFVAADARLNDIELVYELASPMPSVFCDPIQIQQVALNLIRNAIDAMQEINRRFGNRLVIRTTHAVGWIEFAVVDCGSGVSQDDEPLVFSAFHTTKKDGMGMGLSICRSIINQHGGQLSFHNNETHGATFYFRLPTGGESE